MNEDLDLGEFIQRVDERLREQNLDTPITIFGNNEEPSVLGVGDITYTLNDEYIDALPTGLIGSRGEPGAIGDRTSVDFNWGRIDNTGTVTLDASTMATGVLRTQSDRLADYMQEYLSIRNNEMPMLINYNTSEREIQYDDIEAVILFREKLDRIIKQNYQNTRN